MNPYPTPPVTDRAHCIKSETAEIGNERYGEEYLLSIEMRRQTSKYFYLSICLIICLSIYLAAHLSVCFFDCLSIRLTVSLSVCLSLNISHYLFLSLPLSEASFPPHNGPKQNHLISCMICCTVRSNKLNQRNPGSG